MKKINLLIALICFLFAGFIAYKIVWAFPPSPPADPHIADITSGTITGANITDTPISGSTGSFTTLSTTDNATIGSATAGKNLTVNATLGTELVDFTPAGWNEDASTWTMGATGPLVHVAGNTTAVTATLGAAIVAGTTYKVVIKGTGGGGTATYTLGGVTGTTIAASGAIEITDYITASTTGSLIITTASACTVSITSISVKALTDATGDVTIEGNLVVKSPVTTPSLTLFGGSYNSSLTANGPALTISNGAYIVKLSNQLLILASDSMVLAFGSANDAQLTRDAANTIAQRGATAQQAFNLYNTYTNSSNYERLAITGVQGASLNITAETAGTGGDNLDIVLTPAGTGKLRNGVDRITVGSGTGITVIGAGNINRQLYRVTTTYAAYTDSDTTKGIVIATLPAKMKIVSVYADTTTPYTGGTVSAATLEVGITAEGAAEIIAVHDVKSAAVTKGLADADMGTGMTRAAQIQSGYTPSWTGTTAIYATIDTTEGNLNALTAGSTTFYIETEQY